VNTLLGLLVDASADDVKQPRVTPIRERIVRGPEPAVGERQVHNQQIHALVQQLFFRRESKPARHVGFVTVEGFTDTATLCLQVATVLADEDRYDVGLIDANPESLPLETRLKISVASRDEPTVTIGPRLWLVPRQSWLPAPCGHRVTDQNLSRLHELTAEFDFSILWCAPASWLTASIGQTCDGLVLVLTANKTRRIVASHIKDQLSKAHVAVLGTVLADRRFPVPQGLYRSL
jgi:Mrp family chromosome partitioning ATPase